MTKAEQRRALRRFRVFVAAFKAWRPTKTEGFDMGCWRRRTDCGTVHCAWGLAPSIPSLARAGVSFGWTCFTRTVTYTDASGEERTGFSAAEACLGITLDEAEAAFHESGYRNKRWRRSISPRQRDPIRKSEVTAKLNALLRKKEREFKDAWGVAA